VCRAPVRPGSEEAMFELLALGTILLFGLLVLGLVGAILKMLFWLVFLPLRLAAKLIMLPVIALGFLFKIIFGVLLLPVVAVGGIVALLGFGLVAVLGILVPLLPVVLAGLVVWGLVKLFSRPAAVSRV
jgi:hypothetical protein